MRHLLNTLFVNSEDIYLSLDGENVVANRGRQEVARYPLHILSGIVSFSYAGASPALMGACVQTGCVPGVLYAPGPVSRPGVRGVLRECSAAADPISNGG